MWDAIRVSSPKKMQEESTMAGSELPTAMIQSQLAIQAQLLVSGYAQSHGMLYLCDGPTQIRINPTTILTADVTVWHSDRIEPPIFVLEVREPTEKWLVRLERMVEYLRIGVPAVIILDPKTESASVFRSGTRQETFEKDETLTIPDVLPGFALPVAQFFEE
jgi:Uma2 family endonuclease